MDLDIQYNLLINSFLILQQWSEQSNKPSLNHQKLRL